MSAATAQAYLMEVVESAVAMGAFKALSLDDKVMQMFDDGSVPMKAGALGLVYFLASDAVDYVMDGQSKLLSMNYIATANDILYFSLGNLILYVSTAEAVLMGLVSQLPGNLSPSTQITLATGAKLAAMRIVGKVIQDMPGGVENPLKGVRFPASWLKQIAGK